MNRKLELLPGLLTIHRLHPDDPIPPAVSGCQPCFIGRTDRELSIVCSPDVDVISRASDPGWCAFRVAGQLDFELTGILAGLSSCLADADISLFAVSTFETDYILVKLDRLADVRATLENAGYQLLEAEPSAT